MIRKLKNISPLAIFCLVLLTSKTSIANVNDSQSIAYLTEHLKIEKEQIYAFDSEISDDPLKDPILSSGVVNLFPNGKVNWSQNTPSKKNYAYTIKPGGLNAIQNADSSDRFFIVAHLLANFADSHKIFTLNSSRTLTGDIFIVLKGKPETNIAEVKLSFDKTVNTINTISLSYFKGKVIKFTFRKLYKKSFAKEQLDLPKPNESTQIDLSEMREVQSKLSANRFLTINFEQKVYKAMRKRTRSSEGKAYFAKPNKFRWIFKKPSRKEWIYDGNQLINYLPDQKSAIRYSAKAPQAKELRQIVDMVLNLDSLLAKFDLSSAKKKGDLLSLKIVPKKRLQIEFAELNVDLKDYYISLVRLHFRGDNHTTFLFKKPSTASLSQGQFSLPEETKFRSDL